MKKLVAAVLTFAMVLFILPMSAFAVSPAETASSKVVFDDGSYMVTTISGLSTFGRTASLQASSKTGKKTVKYYSSGNTLEWDFSVTATFTYDGTTAKATSASASHNIYVSGWTCTFSNTSYASNTATASGTFKHSSLLTKNTSTTLRCSPSGELS